MKKILFINTTFGSGGAPKVARDLFDELKKGGDFEPFFAYGRGLKVDEKNVIKIGNFLEFYLHVFLVRFLGIEGLGSYFSTKKLINLIKKERFDTIHLHNIHGYYLNFPAFFGFLKKIDAKIIWTFHDEWPINSFKAHSMGCPHCRTGAGKCSSSYSYPKTYFPFLGKYNLIRKKKSFIGLKNLTIISPAKWLSDEIKKSFLKNYEIKYIPNGVDTDLFKPSGDKKILRKKYFLPEDKKIILFTAHKLKDKNKGISHVFYLAEKFPDRFFLGMGSGIESNFPNLKIYGYVNNKKILADLYALSDVFLFPSYAETAPLAALEAMSSGLPVIGFDIPAIKEIAGDSEVLVELGDKEALKEFLSRLLSDEEQIKNLGQLARGKIERDFDKNVFLMKYLEIYKSLW